MTTYTSGTSNTGKIIFINMCYNGNTMLHKVRDRRVVRGGHVYNITLWQCKVKKNNEIKKFVASSQLAANPVMNIVTAC